MNGPSTNSSARPRSNGGSISNTSAVPSNGSPISAKSKARVPKRRHEAEEGASSSVESADDDLAIGGARKRQPGVKRACNECRQQKLKCDVVTEPEYQACERCRRLRLQCRIDTNFKRVGKRSRHAEMEREIEELKQQLATYEPSRPVPDIKSEQSPGGTVDLPQMDTFMGSEEAVASLMDLASGQEGGSFMRSPNARLLISRRIGDVVLGQDQVHELFQIYFGCYHPFLQILDETCAPDTYYESSKILFWAIISVAARKYATNPMLINALSPHVNNLIWEQVKEVPQTYLFCKAICLLCTWPLPVSSTSSDNTYVLSGLNMHVAMSIGLHRPSHVQDFSKFKADLMEDELRDRVRTWASCNAVAQRVSTGYGQPPATLYDWTLDPSGPYPPGFILPRSAQNRLLIEKFSNRITHGLYRNDTDQVGLASDESRVSLSKIFAQEYLEVERRLVSPDQFAHLYLRAAGLHFRLSIFFASPASKDYNEGLLALWHATTAYLESALSIGQQNTSLLEYSSSYVLQMMTASAFALLKLLSSFFASYVEVEYGRSLFLRTVKAIRNISISPNDLPSRFAEVLSQLWKGSGAGSPQSQIANGVMENSLQLKVKCRMSMSLVFDSVWRWREEFQSKGRGNLEAAVKNPTNPDSNVESSATSVADAGLAPSLAPGDNRSLTPNRSITPLPDGFGIGEGYNEVFDPLNWMFDGYVDFPNYTMPPMPDLEGNNAGLQ